MNEAQARSNMQRKAYRLEIFQHEDTGTSPSKLLLQSSLSEGRARRTKFRTLAMFSEAVAITNHIATSTLARLDLALWCSRLSCIQTCTIVKQHAIGLGLSCKLAQRVFLIDLTSFPPSQPLYRARNACPSYCPPESSGLWSGSAQAPCHCHPELLLVGIQHGHPGCGGGIQRSSSRLSQSDTDADADRATPYLARKGHRLQKRT